jgi:mono/diheme cytochrome c family protein
MRSVQLLGLRMVVGVLALGSMLAVMGYQWQEATYGEKVVVKTSLSPERVPAASAPASVTAGGRQALVFAQVPIAAVQAAPVAAQANGDVTRGQQLYEQMCAGCHTIGAGPRAGPDLQNVIEERPHDWLVETIVDPGARYARGDPTALELEQEYGMRMPNLGVTEPQAIDMLAYIEAQSVGILPDPAPEIELPEGDAERGRALFVGTQRFSGGGPACVACHDIEGVGYFQGGTWSTDLGGAVGRMGPAGFAAITQAPPFPAMRVAYGNEAFTDQELADLVAFVAGTQPGVALPGGQLFPFMGLALFVVMVGASHLIWRGRARQFREPRLRHRRH